MTGDVAEVYRAYYEAGLTDGLPVVPPTDERVETMLAGTDLSPETDSAGSATGRGSYRRNGRGQRGDGRLSPDPYVRF